MTTLFSQSTPIPTATPTPSKSAEQQSHVSHTTGVNIYRPLSEVVCLLEEQRHLDAEQRRQTQAAKLQARQRFD